MLAHIYNINVANNKIVIVHFYCKTLVYAIFQMLK